jgi:hypothetical protein
MKKIKDSEWETIWMVFCEIRNGVDWNCDIAHKDAKTIKKYFGKHINKYNQLEYGKIVPMDYPELCFRFVQEEIDRILQFPKMRKRK